MSISYNGEKRNQYAYRKIQGIVGEQSLSVILPKSYAISLGIGKGDFVKVHLEGRKIIVERADP
jgi:hypothetical protein